MKLLAAVGAFLGSSEIMGALGLIAVLGAGYALLSVTWRGLLPLLVFNTLELVKGWLTLGRAGAIRKLESPNCALHTLRHPNCPGHAFLVVR